MVNLITENIAVWTTAQTAKTNGRGKKASNQSLHGVNKLRELILELAVRGKLVPQDPKDEPASVLLEKITTEKERLIKEGKIKKQKSLPEIGEDEKPYHIPKNWTWSRLTELYYSISPSQKKLKNSEIMKTGKYPVIDQGKSFIAGFTDDLRLLIQIPGPVIVFGDHTTEKKYIDFDFVAGADGTKILRPYHMDEQFFYTYLLKYKLENRGYARHFKVLNDNLMALPPLTEQHRIVAKVDELMALCDQLEQQQTDSNAAHQILVETVLDTLTNAADQAELESAWQRIAGNFDALFTTEQSIDQLKQTILQLAVMGRLVPQNPDDEPASELLKKIAVEKAQLIKAGKIKAQKQLPEIGEGEKPFDLPKMWKWVPWGYILALDDAAFKRGPFGSSLKKDMFVSSGYKVYEQYCPINDDCSFERYYITEEKFENMKAFSVKANDYLVSCSGVTLGRITQVPEEFKEGIINQALLRIRINHTYVDKSFFKLLFRSPYFQKLIFDNSTGSAIPNVKGVKILKAMPVPLLPISEQRKIVAKFNELFAVCDALKDRLKDAQAAQINLANAIVEQAVV